jgi:hypothetical protein
VIDVELPALAERLLHLTPERDAWAYDVYRGGAVDSDDEVYRHEPEPLRHEHVPAADVDISLAGRVRFGGPVAVPVTEDYVAGDPDLAAYVAGQAKHSAFFLVHLAVTLRTQPDDPPFESASVRVRLSADGAAQPPIAWSLRPLRLADTTEVSTNWRLGPELGLYEVDVALGGVDHTRTGRREEVFLEGFGELGSDPEWLLSRTSARRLHGSHRLIMVVRAPRGTTTQAAVTVRARVRTRRLLWYRTKDLDPLLIRAELR